MIAPGERGLAELGDEALVTEEEVARLDGATEQAQHVGEPVHHVEAPAVARVPGQPLGRGEGVLEQVHRFVERVPARDLVSQVHEIVERPTGLVGAREVVGEPVVHLVEPSRVHDLDGLARSRRGALAGGGRAALDRRRGEDANA